MSEIADSGPLLAIDLGSVTTRAALFDVVDGQYRFVAGASVPTTADAPISDVGEGARRALEQLRAVTGRSLLDEDGAAIVSAADEASGVESLSITASVGPPVRVVLAGLMPDVSLASARRLAASGYFQVVDELSLGDRRRPEQQLDAIVAARPDVVIAAGGTDGGSSDAVLKLIETIGLATHVLPAGHKPVLLFAGNAQLADRIMEMLSGIVDVRAAPNIRPGLDRQNLAPARTQLADLFQSTLSKQVPGFADVIEWSGGRVLSTADAMALAVRMLGQTQASGKAMLGLDLGASSTVVAASLAGQGSLSVQLDLGLGVPAAGLLQHITLADFKRWLPIQLSDDQVRETLYNKSLHPRAIPAETNDLLLEHAVAREILRLAISRARSDWPDSAGRGPDPAGIIAGGAALTQSGMAGRAALVLLDAVQPVGVTTLALDPSGLLPAMGALASANPVAALQVLGSPTGLMHLGTVISPVGHARTGETILKLDMVDASGQATHAEAQFGSLHVLPLPAGSSAELTLTPLHRFDVGLGGPGRGGRIRATGGALGVVVDARGRPIQLPPQPEQRLEAAQKWLWELGG